MDKRDQWNDLEFHRSWEQPPSFNEVLAEQLRKAPYVLASLAIHAICGFALAGLQLLSSNQTQAPILEMVAQPPPPVVEEDPPPPDEVVKEIIPEPVLQETDMEEVVEKEALEEIGDPNFLSESPFDREAFNNDIGVGGPPGGNKGLRGGRGNGRRGNNLTEKAVQDALQWLVDHQTPNDGYWDCDDFMLYDKYPEHAASDGPGSPVNDVGVTGLALLALLGRGNTMDRGEFRENVAVGINWLKNVQQENGLIGDEVGDATLYNHSIAAMALGEAHYFANSSPILKKNVKDAVKLILNAQNSYNAWRYKLEPNGDNDTSITGWMVFALKTAEDAKVPVPTGAYEGAENWFTSMTAPDTGRTGYSFAEGGPGSAPARKRIYLEKFPPDRSEALTAVALLCRLFMTDTNEVRDWRDHENYSMLKKQADLLVQKLPVWDEQGGSIDMYYWYYATFALNQWGGKHWKAWKKAIEKSLLTSQRQDGNFKGSWDPQHAAWGHSGGRVYTTALGALILEVYYRYSPLLGGR